MPDQKPTPTNSSTSGQIDVPQSLSSAPPPLTPVQTNPTTPSSAATLPSPESVTQTPSIKPSMGSSLPPTQPSPSSIPEINPSPSPVQPVNPPLKPTSVDPTPPPPPVQPPANPTTTNPPGSSKPALTIKKSPFRFVGPLLAILLVGGLIAFGVSRLLGGATQPTQNVTLTYWGLWEPSQALKNTFDSFSAQNPGVTVNYVMQSPKEYRERLQAAIARGQGPDIFRFHNTWTPMLKAELATLPKSVMSTSQFESTFYPITQKDLKVGSNYVGIPLEIDGLALYYNQTIFKNANKTPPTTWEELRQLALELTLRDEEERIVRGGVALGTTGNVEHWSDIVALMMLQNAANPANPTDELAQDSIAFYTIFSKTDKVWDDTLPTSTLAFANQKVTMMIAPSWRALEVKDLNPQLEFATVPVPQLPNTNLTWASYWAEGVNSKADKDKQELAWELLNFMSQPENLRAFYADASQVRLFGEPYSRQDMATELASDPIVGAYITSAQTAQSWWLSSWTHDNGLNDRIIKYYEDAINAVNSGRSASQALETTGEGVVQVLSQFGVSGALR